MAVDLMIVGAPKSGTTALLTYLGHHPGVHPQRQLEMTWFADAHLQRTPFPEEVYFGAQERDGRLRLGKSAGLMYREATIARLHDLNPAVHAIAVLREPVARMYSAFQFSRQRGRESSGGFEEALDAAGGNGFREFEGSLYSAHVQLLFDLLGRDSVHVIIFEELVEEPKAALLPLLEVLDLDPDGLGTVLPQENVGQAARSQRLARARRSNRLTRAARHVLSTGARDRMRHAYRRVNESDLRPPGIDPALEADLRRRFLTPNQELEALLGRPIERWRAASVGGGGGGPPGDASASSSPG